MNLISNAVESLEDQGLVSISTRNRYIDTCIKGYDEVKEGDYVILNVTDNGAGISKEDLEKIFEPFYTKKTMGRRGTGLGMAVEYMQKNTADLVILDMIMAPAIDGLDTYKRILALHPKQRAIIASGFSETDRIKEAQRLGAGEYVKKPYTLEKIGLAVKTELAR
jgi:response regulator of citrate/malate metabolism